MTILSPQLGISPTATAGGETYDREVLKQFVKLGQDVKILLPKGKPVPVDISEKLIDRTPFSHFVPPYSFNFFSLPWVFRQIKQLTINNLPADQRAMSRERIVPKGEWQAQAGQQLAILRIHSPEYLFPTAYLTKKFFPEVAMVAHYHLDQTGKLWTAMNRKLLNMSDAVIADSQYLKERLVNRVGVVEEKIRVIHCGVDVGAIKPRATSHEPRATKVVLFLGRFIERKRPDFVLDVFAKLHRKYPNTKLVMVGEGPLQRQLQQQVTGYRLQNSVEFTGPLFGEEKLKRYHEADLFLFPSEREGFVLVVLEAMAAGLPLLVPRSLGFGEAVEDGENGLLATPGYIDDWVGKAEKILFNAKMNRVMKERSRKLAVEKFSWEQCAKKNLEVYSKLLSLRSLKLDPPTLPRLARDRSG